MKIEYHYFRIDSNIEEIEKLPFLHQIAFFASICERSLPNFKAYTDENATYQDFSIFRKALDEVWLFLSRNKTNLVESNQLRADCDRAFDEIDYSFEFGSYAFRATSSVYFVLENIFVPTNKIARALFSRTYETLAEYIENEIESLEYEKFGMQETDDDWSKKTVEEQELITASHPLVVREIRKENENLQLLKETQNLTPEFVRQFRISALEYTNGKSLIDLD